MQRVLAYAMRNRWLVPFPFCLAKLQGAFLQLLPIPPLTSTRCACLRATMW